MAGSSHTIAVLDRSELKVFGVVFCWEVSLNQNHNWTLFRFLRCTEEVSKKGANSMESYTVAKSWTMGEVPTTPVCLHTSGCGCRQSGTANLRKGKQMFLCVLQKARISHGRFGPHWVLLIDGNVTFSMTMAVLQHRTLD